MQSTTRRILAIPAAAIFFSALLLIGTSGCNIVVPAAYIIGGPPSKDAEFVLPEKRTVVFIDDTRNFLPRTSLRTRIADKVVTLLIDKGKVEQAIASTDALQVARRRDTDTKKLSVSEIGEEVGAETVIYVKIVSFVLTPDGETPRPAAEAQVKVLDIGGARRLFPDPAEGGDGRTVQARLREMDIDSYRTSAGRRKIEDLLADDLGIEIAKLFHSHEIKELGGRLGVR